MSPEAGTVDLVEEVFPVAGESPDLEVPSADLAAEIPDW
jgi:hypothetical protein